MLDDLVESAARLKGGPVVLRAAEYHQRADAALQSFLLKYWSQDHGGRGGDCEAAADVDGNGAPNVTDAVYLLRYIFRAGNPPAAPFPECGPSPPGSSTGCEEFAPCQ